MQLKLALSFDDVLLKPAASDILPAEVDTSTQLTSKIRLSIPLLSAAMDTVTESAMAIAMGQLGGLGIVHKNMEIDRQAEEIRRVKKFESGIVFDPITIFPDRSLADALSLMADHHISGIPVVAGETCRLVGILTNRDVRFATDPGQPVSELMTKEGLITIRENVGLGEAKRLLHKHRIEKLIVVDDDYRCIGLITVKDIEKSQAYPNANKDAQGRIRVGGATGVGDAGIARAEALADAGADAVIVDTAHGHSSGVLETVRRLRQLRNGPAVIAGNVATADGAKALIDAGADAIKIGIGPGSICTTRIVAGVGVPQFTAICDAAEVCLEQGIGVIADGGVRFSGDLAKALAAGASVAMIGSMLAGTDESPGEVFLYQGRSYKSYRGMGSVAAMAQGSADRYFQQEVADMLKLVPEGVEGRVPYKGPVSGVVHQLVGGLRAAMGYTGNGTIDDMRRNCEFLQVTTGGQRESHVHDVTITREAPNYRQNG